MSGEQQFERGRVTKAIIVDGQTVIIRVGEDDARLRYELFSQEPLGKSAEDSVIKRIIFFLSLGDDLKPFYSIAQEKDDKFYPLVEKLWGLHQVKFPTLLEISCWAILTQRVQRPIALRMKRNIVERFGGHLELEGKTYWAFPDYTRLKSAKSKELLEATRNQRAVIRMTSLLTTFDELDEEFLRTAPYEKAAERLKKVKGIGDWSSQFILFRGLGRMEKIQAINIRPLSETIDRLYGPKGMTIDDINSTYGKWSGYWTMYLWASTMKTNEDEEEETTTD